jgi:hypothetical protein
MWWLGVTCDRKGYPQSRTFSPPRTASSWKLGVFAQWRRALRSGTTWSPWRPGQLLCLGSRAGVKLYLSYVYYDLLAWNWSWKKIKGMTYVFVPISTEGQAGGKTQTSLPASPTSGAVLYGMGCLHIRSGTSLILFGWFSEENKTGQFRTISNLICTQVVFHILASPRKWPCQPCQSMTK